MHLCNMKLTLEVHVFLVKHVKDVCDYVIKQEQAMQDKTFQLLLVLKFVANIFTSVIYFSDQQSTAGTRISNYLNNNLNQNIGLLTVFFALSSLGKPFTNKRPIIYYAYFPLSLAGSCCPYDCTNCSSKFGIISILSLHCHLLVLQFLSHA